MGLEGVGGLAIHEILVKLGPKDTALVGCVSKRFRDWADDESLWSKFCSDELQLSSPEDPFGNPTSTFKAAYQIWREAFGMYPWPLVRRVNRCWGRLKCWLSENFPEALVTLRKGASEDEIKEFENHLKIKLPLPTRVLYRFCDGQELLSKYYGGRIMGSPLGLIGGYCFYDQLVNVYLLPLSQVTEETQYIVHQVGFSHRSNYIVVATSSTDVEKSFLLNCADGQLYVGTRNLSTDWEMIPCVPNALISSVHDSGGSEQQDGMLLWLEEHGRRLHNGIIKLRKEGNSRVIKLFEEEAPGLERKIRSINLFPEEAPQCSTAVTNGVQVRASSVLVPEFSDLLHESRKYLFSYSIRMSLLPEGCIINGLSFASCQLHWRHWIIRANDVVVSDVNGEAVIGKFPLLRPGEEEFTYESCSYLSSSSGSIEGSFTFVPGRLADPKGSPFEVEVARFPLQLPDYVF